MITLNFLSISSQDYVSEVRMFQLSAKNLFFLILVDSDNMWLFPFLILIFSDSTIVDLSSDLPIHPRVFFIPFYRFALLFLPNWLNLSVLQLFHSVFRITFHHVVLTFLAQLTFLFLCFIFFEFSDLLFYQVVYFLLPLHLQLTTLCLFLCTSFVSDVPQWKHRTQN